MSHSYYGHFAQKFDFRKAWFLGSHTPTPRNSTIMGHQKNTFSYTLLDYIDQLCDLKSPLYSVALSSKSLYFEISTSPSFLTQMAHLQANTHVKLTDTLSLTLAVDSTAQKTMFWPCALSQFSIFPHQAAIIVWQHPPYITPAHPVNFHNMAPTALLTFLRYSTAPNARL